VHFFKISKILQKDQSVLFDHFDISKFWQEITSRNLALMVLGDLIQVDCVTVIEVNCEVLSCLYLRVK